MSALDFRQIADQAAGATDGQLAASKIRFGQVPPGFLLEQIDVLADRSAAYRDGYLRALEKALSRP